MARFSVIFSLPLIFNLITSIAADCSIHTPAFPSPDYGEKSIELLEAFDAISNALTVLAADEAYNASSYSVEITSVDSTLWTTYHTAEVKNSSRPGANEVNGQSTYRIASITKTFTVLGLLYQDAAGNLSLEDTIGTYIPGLVEGHQAGSIHWKDITLRTLASQLSGIPRDFAQGDMFHQGDDPVQYGFPPVSYPDLPPCDSFANYTPCTDKDLINWLRSATGVPTFAPNQKSTYSNIAFELLGLVIANVTGLSYEKYIQTAILEPLNMTGSSFLQPADSVAVLPNGDQWYWDVDEGIQNPTGGLFATSNDMSKFNRYVLTHFNGITPALNWFQPASFTEGVRSFYGVPWEIFRTDKILTQPSSQRPVTFITKGGGLPGYSTNILLVPEYSLGITILTAGNPGLLAEAREIVTTKLINGAEKFAQRQARTRYAGTFSGRHINSTLEIAASPYRGLYVSKFLSNGTDTLSLLLELARSQKRGEITLQLIPTLMYRDKAQKRGELFRAVVDFTPDPLRPSSVWDGFCVTDVSPVMYAGKSVGEVVFWDADASGGRYDRVELSAFRVSLDRVLGEGDKDGGFADQLFAQEL